MKLNLSNSAAQEAYKILTTEKVQTRDEMFTSGRVANQLKKCRIGCTPVDGESQASFIIRVNEWKDAPYGEFELDEDGKDYLRGCIKRMLDEKRLVGGEYIAELATALKLNEK